MTICQNVLPVLEIRADYKLLSFHSTGRSIHDKYKIFFLHKQLMLLTVIDFDQHGLWSFSN